MATIYTVNSATSITVTSPAGTGTVGVTVTTPVGTSAGSADQFTYEAAPSVTAISPIAGLPAGGTSMTVAGTNFTGASTVDFGTTAAVTYSVVSSTSITVTSPAGTGTVDVTVTTPVGASATSVSDEFTYEAAPTVSAVSPIAGLPAGATTVTITGTGFTDASAVDFGAVAGTTYTVISSTQIVVISPAGAGTVDVTVTTPVGTSTTSGADQFTYESAPAVTAVSPVAGPLTGGTTVTVTGTNFTDASAVDFGTVAASYSVVSATSISATAPAEIAGSVDVFVTTPVGTSANSAADLYAYEPTATITAVSPVAGLPSGGTTVTITGANFTHASAVSFGATPASSYTIVSSTQIAATSPGETAGLVDILVTTPVGTSSAVTADHFTFEGPPAVSAVSPVADLPAGGSTVTITGANFADATAVSFGTTAASDLTVVSATSITVTSPAELAGSVDVVVTTPVGTSATSLVDEFTYEPRTDGQRREPHFRPDNRWDNGDRHRYQLHRDQCGRLRHHGGHQLHGRLVLVDDRHLPGRLRRAGRRHRHHPRRDESLPARPTSSPTSPCRASPH